MGTLFTGSTPNVFIYSEGFFLLPGESEGPLLSPAVVYTTYGMGYPLWNGIDRVALFYVNFCVALLAPLDLQHHHKWAIHI